MSDTRTEKERFYLNGAAVWIESNGGRGPASVAELAREWQRLNGALTGFVSRYEAATCMAGWDKDSGYAKMLERQYLKLRAEMFGESMPPDEVPSNLIYGPDGAIVTQGIYDEAMEEIHILMREVERLTATVKGLIDGRSDVLAERDRLRAALERISRDEFDSPEWDTGTDDFEDDYWRVVNMARQALGPAEETSEGENHGR